MKYYEKEIQHITSFTKIFLQKLRIAMNSELKELNRIICKQCDEKDYEKCKNCKIYQLINKIAMQ
ncbi:MAG: hypothetical protein ACPLVJ_00300 [Candidatus Bathyarchaeales archaeon]